MGGSSNYNAAPDVAHSFNIAKAGQTVSFDTLSDKTFGDADFALSATSSSGLVSEVILSSGHANCVISAFSSGTHTVTAEYSGEANFNSSNATFTGETAAGSIFEFSLANYVVGERGGSITITVKRTGDVSAPASVDYASDDGSTPAVAVPCSVATGIALERCDYTRSAGTLKFAANETEKSFIVLVNDDSYTEGTETSSLILSNPSSSAILGPQATATLQITDDVPESAGNPVDDSMSFVRQHYHDFLNREPDPDGLRFWTNNIASCDRDGCPEPKLVDTSAAFFLSIEFQETGYLVERFYKVAYGDATGTSTFTGPHQLSVPIVRLREFLRDTQEIGLGVVVGQGDWQQQLENHKQTFAQEFVSRERFTNAYPASLTAEQFVSQLNTNAGGVLSDAEVTELETIFGTTAEASADTQKRAQVLRSVVENQNLRQREFNRAFVFNAVLRLSQTQPGRRPGL